MNDNRKINSRIIAAFCALLFVVCSATSGFAQTCGNGVVEAGEQCDGGSTSGGCCTANCTFAAEQTTCYDGNPNTIDSCNAAGVCVGRYQTTTCGACRNPNDQSDTSYCNLTTNQCVRQTAPPCAPFETENGVENKCKPLIRRDSNTGVCIYNIQKQCARRGCFATDCNPTNGLCEVSAADDPRNIRCRGTDDFCRGRNCEITPCRYGQCDPRGTIENCANVIEVNCFAENTNTCLTAASSDPSQGIFNGCQEGIGCIFTVQACAQPTNPCEVLVRDGDAQGCCTTQPRDCAAEFGNNPNYTYTCDPNAVSGVCQATIKPEQCNGADDNGNNQIDEGFPNTDGDAQANCVDPDDDNDNVPDANDAFPLNPNESVDTDNDGIGNNADTDDDNDGQTDADEISCGSNPLLASSKSFDTDNDNRPNCVDTDDDNDGVLDAADNCPLNANPNQADADADGQGDVCDQTPNPIGVQIVFSSTRDSAQNSVNSEIYGMRADGNGVVRLTNNAAQDFAPALSPDKSKILFTSTRDSNRTEIFVMNANGSNVQRLTNNSAVEGIANWSPDGAQIVFTSKRDGNAEIYQMNANGSNVRRLTNNSKTDFNPVWSPDGAKIAFASNRNSDNFEIYTMNTTGGNVVRLTNNSAEDLFPTFSPDSAKIAFTSTRSSNVEIYSMNAANGANVVRLTNNQAIDAEPSWGANNRVVFTSTRDGRTKIFAMNTDGTAVIRLTNNPTGYDLSPDW